MNRLLLGVVVVFLLAATALGGWLGWRFTSDGPEVLDGGFIALAVVSAVVMLLACGVLVFQWNVSPGISPHEVEQMAIQYKGEEAAKKHGIEYMSSKCWTDVMYSRGILD